MPKKPSSSSSRRPPHPPRMAAASESGRATSGVGSPSSSPASPFPPSPAGPYSNSLRLMWASQFISILGTEVSKFALRTWSYEASGAMTDFAWVIFLSELPAILLSPLSGPVVDRYNRKVLMLASDLTAGVATLVLCLLWRQGAMGLHHIYAAVTLQAVCNSVQLPAFMASLSLLLAGREEELVKLNSVSQTLSGVAMLLAPIISSALLKTQGSLAWVFAFDLSTLLLAVLVMLATRIPAPAARYQGLLGAAERQHSAGSTSSTGSGDYAGQPLGTMASPLFSPSQQQQQHQQQQQQSAGAIVRKLWRDNAEAWCFLQGHKGLLALLLVVAQIQLSNGAFQILSTPIILSFTAEPAAIAGVLTVSGVGAMLGFALPVAFKHANAHRARTVLACVLGQGLLLLFLVVPRLPVIMAVAFGYMLLVPLSRSCREAIWMQKVPCDMQGRVFSLQHSIAKAALPVAAVLAGPLVDLILEPLVDGVPTLAALAGGAAPNAVGPGGGKTRGGRGSALLALLLGVANVGCAAAAFLHPLYRALDERPAAGEAWQHKE